MVLNPRFEFYFESIILQNKHGCNKLGQNHANTETLLIVQFSNDSWREKFKLILKQIERVNVSDYLPSQKEKQCSFPLLDYSKQNVLCVAMKKS